MAVAVAVVIGASACASSGSPYEGMAADDIWSTGLEAFEVGEWNDAIRAFEELVSVAPGHPRAPEARLHMGLAYMERRDYLTAVSEFERILELHPTHAIVSQASLGVCRAYSRLAPHPQRDQRYTQRGRDACTSTILEHPGTEAAEEAAAIRADLTDRLAEATYDVARFYQRRSLNDPAIVYFEEVAERYPETEWAPRALLAMFRVYRDRGWTPEANEAAERLMARHPESEAANRLRQEDGVPQEILGGASAEDGP